MSSTTKPDASQLTSGILTEWYGYALPAEAADRAGVDIARLVEAYRQLPPPPFDLQIHHFAPLLERLADD